MTTTLHLAVLVVGGVIDGVFASHAEFVVNIGLLTSKPCCCWRAQRFVECTKSEYLNIVECPGQGKKLRPALAEADPFGASIGSAMACG